MTRPRLHLASGSPRRRELLQVLGVDFTWAGADVDERRRDGEVAEEMVLRLAVAKANAASQHSGAVLAADTAVALGSQVFGKPDSEAAALAMLDQLSGRTHEVYTGVAVAQEGATTTALSRSQVVFRDIDPAERSVYWQSGEPKDKAGSYAIQGLGAVFVRELRGSYSGVVGLPLYETAELLRGAGIDVLAVY